MKSYYIAYNDSVQMYLHIYFSRGSVGRGGPTITTAQDARNTRGKKQPQNSKSSETRFGGTSIKKASKLTDQERNVGSENPLTCDFHSPPGQKPNRTSQRERLLDSISTGAASGPQERALPSVPIENKPRSQRPKHQHTPPGAADDARSLPLFLVFSV